MVYLFDIDGTLLLSGGAGTRALNRVFSERFAVSDAMLGIECAGRTDPLIVGDIVRARLSRDLEVGELTAILDTYVAQMAIEIPASPTFRLMPAVVEALDYLQGHSVPLGLATGNIAAAARLKLLRPNLWDRFAFGGFGDDSAVRSELVQVAIDRAAAAVGPVDRTDIVVVGDTPHDVSAARACGVRVVVVPTGSYDRTQLEACAPDAVLDTLADLPAWHTGQPRPT